MPIWLYPALPSTAPRLGLQEGMLMEFLRQHSAGGSWRSPKTVSPGRHPPDFSPLPARCAALAGAAACGAVPSELLHNAALGQALPLRPGDYSAQACPIQQPPVPAGTLWLCPRRAPLWAELPSPCCSEARILLRRRQPQPGRGPQRPPLAAPHRRRLTAWQQPWLGRLCLPAAAGRCAGLGRLREGRRWRQTYHIFQNAAWSGIRSRQG